MDNNPTKQSDYVTAEMYDAAKILVKARKPGLFQCLKSAEKLHTKKTLCYWFNIWFKSKRIPYLVCNVFICLLQISEKESVSFKQH